MYDMPVCGSMTLDPIKIKGQQNGKCVCMERTHFLQPADRIMYRCAGL